MNKAEIMAAIAAAADRAHPSVTSISVPIEWVRALVAVSTPGDDTGVSLASLGIAEKQLAILSDLGLHTVAEAVAYHHDVARLEDIAGVGAATQAKILGLGQ